MPEEITKKKFDSGHDPIKAEGDSVDSVRKAEKTGPTAKKRKGDQTGGDKTAPKADSGIVRELYNKITNMTSEDLRALHGVMMDEDFMVESLDEDDEDVFEDIEYDFDEDLKDLIDSEATLSEEFKEKTSVILETAIKTKLNTEINRLEEAYSEQLDEELEIIQNELSENINSYLKYVVENWMEENELAVESGLRTEIAENFMTSLKDLFVENYIQVPEEKVDLVDDLSEQVEALSEELNETTKEYLESLEELQEYKREAIILDCASDLADTQLDKLATLAEDINYVDDEDFQHKVEIIKESYFSKKKQPKQQFALNEDYDNEETDEVEISEQMQKYVNVLKKTNN